LGWLTPSEFMTISPIEKEYNGHKWGFKDYFYTRDYINTLDPSKPIGQEEALHFIWNTITGILLIQCRAVWAT